MHTAVNIMANRNTVILWQLDEAEYSFKEFVSFELTDPLCVFDDVYGDVYLL